MSWACEEFERDFAGLMLAGWDRRAESRTELDHPIPLRRGNVVATPVNWATSMPKDLTADDLLPLIAKLSSEERHRLLRLAFRVGITDVAAYAAQPVGSDEFENDEEALGWDADGWDDVG